MKRLDFRDPQTMKLQYSIDVPRCAGHQSRRLLDRRHVRDLHVRIRGHRRQDRPRQPQGAGLHAGDPARPADQDRQGAGRQRRDHLHDVEGHAAGHPRVARRQALLRRRHDGRRRARRRRRDVRGRSASSRPARARTASIRAATARSSTSPIAARTRSTARRRARAACRSSTSRRRRSRRTGRFPAAAAPTWATSAPTASGCGYRAATTTSCTRSTRRSGAVKIIPVGKEPHGLTVWPQPGRYSLGHTGNLR